MKKILSILSMVFVFTLSGKAQTLVDDSQPDTVVVTSVSAYAVDRDANVQLAVDAGIFDPSQFDWVLSGGGAIDQSTTGLGFYAEDSIGVTWANSPGQFALSVAENSIRSGAVACADATPSQITIEVVALPTVQFTGTDAGACGAQDYSITMGLTGYGPWDVTYDIEYTDLNGNNSVVSSDNAASIGAYGDSGGSYDLDVLSGDLGAGNAGTYTVTLTNIDDRFTDKSLSAVDGTVGAQATFDIYIYPSPSTSPIRHLPNN